MIAAAGYAIVTGGSSGIGQALCVALVKHGYQLAVVGQSVERLEETRRLLSAFGLSDGENAHLFMTADVSDPEQVHNLVTQSQQHFGRLDVLICSAGIGRSAELDRVIPHATADLPLTEWNAVLAVNLRGVFLCSAAVLPHMQKQRAGHIINIGSSTTPEGLRGTAYGPAYCASKFGVVGLTESVAAENERYGIRAQVVFPGPVETPLVHQTVLARPFGGSIAADSFAESVVRLIAQPTDGVIIHPHLLPFRGTHHSAAHQLNSEPQ